MGIECLTDIAEIFCQVIISQNHSINWFKIVQNLQKMGITMQRIGLDMVQDAVFGF